MKIFTTPYLCEYGKANKLIQGECGWGSENYTMDKTGYKNFTYRAYKTHVGTNWTDTQCADLTKCAKSKPKDLC